MPLRPRVLGLALALAFATSTAQAEPFTFQGYVENAGSPINGDADMKFRIYGTASGGSQLGNEIVQPDYPVANGVFTIDLDAGTALAFDGDARFLEVEVNGQVLSPRLEILPAPLASSSNALRGRAVSDATPASGNVLTWTGTQWAPQAPSGGGGSYSAGTGLDLSGTTFSVAPSYRLPQDCANDQLTQWNGSGWVCANVSAGTTYSAGAGLTLAGTVFSANFAGSGAAASVARSDHNHFGHSWSGNGQHGIYIVNSQATDFPVAVYGLHDGAAAGGAGVRGTSSNGTGVVGQGVTGVVGFTSAPTGTGVQGSGGSVGVHGLSSVSAGIGVKAESQSTTGMGAGLAAEARSPDGAGVFAVNNASSGDAVGIYATTSSTSGLAVLAEGPTAVDARGMQTGVVGSASGGADSVGVLGVAAHPGAAVRGVKGMVQAPDAIGVYGENLAASGLAYGLVGATNSSSGVGVFGAALNGGTGMRGEGRFGVVANATEIGVDAAATVASGQAIGVRGASGSPDGAGMLAINSAVSGVAYGIYSQTNSTAGTAVIGDALANSGSPIGVHGRSVSGSGIAVRAENTSVTGSGNALIATGAASGGDTMVVNAQGSGNAWAISAASAGSNGRVLNAQLTNNASTGVAIYSQVASASARAGQFVNLAGGEAARFDGNVNVVGNHTVSGTKSFRIDHPLDPENRYLLHYNLEGPEPFNLYRGTVKLDMTGAAEIELPEYFEAINIDLSYQLTAVGAAMPNLHVAREVDGNRFSVAGGVAGKSVSWQVTAVRNDPWVRDRGFQADVEKPAAEKGRYLYPAGYGKNETKGIDFELRSEKSGAQ